MRVDLNRIEDVFTLSFLVAILNIVVAFLTVLGVGFVMGFDGTPPVGWQIYWGVSMGICGLHILGCFIYIVVDEIRDVFR